MPRRKKTDTDGGEATPVSAAQAVLRRLESEDISSADDKESAATEFISTQNLLLDLSLNMPGIPVGRLTVIRGWESSGKTTLVTHLVAETQRLGGIAVLLDSEFAFDDLRAKTVGVDTDELLLGTPETIESAITEIEDVIDAIRDEFPDKLALVVWDSVAATATQAEIEGEFGDGKAVGAHAKLISTAMRRIRGTIKAERIALVVVNQNRENVNIGPFGGSSSGSRMIAEKPLGFHASLIIDMAKGEELYEDKKEKKNPYGIKARTKVTKNKCSNPFGRATVICTFDHGFDQPQALLEVAVKIGMIDKNRGWYNMPGVDAFHEKDFVGIIDDDPDLQEKITSASYAALWPPNVHARFPELVKKGKGEASVAEHTTDETDGGDSDNSAGSDED